MPTMLKGITWGHSRGYTSLVAVGQRFHELHPGVDFFWEKRSLQEFADAPIQNLAEAYDLLVIDHPWAGHAAHTGILLPLDQYLDGAFLADQAANSVGASHRSYNFAGFQSALAIDAAAPVAVYRPDYFEQQELLVPTEFEQVLELAQQGIVAYAAIPINLLMDFYMFCNTVSDTLFASEQAVVNQATGCEALEAMRQLACYCSPDIFDWDPIAVHEALATDSGLAYCPFAYGYTNYSRLGYGQHLLKAGDLVWYQGAMLKSVLGGTGLAISAASKQRESALAFAQYAASPLVQRTLYFDAGGQPGHRSAWLDETTNSRTLNFFQDTLTTLDNAYLRPRYAGYLHFQDRAGSIIQEYVREGGSPDRVLDLLNGLYRRSKEGI